MSKGLRATTGEVAAVAVVAGMMLAVSLGLGRGYTSTRPTPVSPTGGAWVELAKRVPAKIADSDELCGVVKRLHEGGDLGPEQVAAFERAFPGVLEKRRPLTEADAATLRGLP